MHESTCWTVIEAAARGEAAGRERFALQYEKPVRQYLLARWRSTAHLQNVDDVVQDVFVECFRQGGVLERVEARRPGGFRAFLYGLVRNLARGWERREHSRTATHKDVGSDIERLPCDELSLSQVFDRAWATTIMKQAIARQRERAVQTGEPAQRRVELLRLRFQEDLPIRVIAQQWQVDTAHLHHEYAKARVEFRAALQEVVAFHQPGSEADIEAECRDLLSLL